MLTFDVEGHRFVSDLFWEDISSPRAWRREARQSFSAQNMGDVNAGVLRLGATPQVGLLSVDFSDKANRNLLSAAAVVAKSIEMDYEDSPSYLVAVPVTSESGGQAWYISGGDGGLILPGFDRLIDDEDEAHALVRESMATGEWELIIAPEDWQIGAHTAAEGFADFLPRTKKGEVKVHAWWRPTKLTMSASDYARKGAPAIALVGLGAVAYIATPFVMDITSDEPAPPPPPTDTDEPIPDRPAAWQTGMLPTERLVEACQAQINEWPRFAGAWRLVNADCSASAPSESLTGSVNASTAGAFERPEDAPTVGLEGAIESVSIEWANGARNAFASTSASLELITMDGPMGVTAFWKAIEKRRRVYESIGVETTPYPERQTSEGERIPPPPGQRFNVSVTTDVGPSQVFSGMTCSGVSANYTVEQQTWQIEGQCYASD